MESNWLSRKLLQLRRQFLPYYFVGPPRWKILLRTNLGKRRMTPTFASLGAVRSGTSLLADYIIQHPCVVLPLAKEIGFSHLPFKHLIKAQFPTEKERSRIERQYGGTAITGYCAPIMPYAGFPYLASEVLSESETRFIIILRNPVERTFAHWRWDSVLLRGVKQDPLWKRFPDFGEAMRLELEYIQSGGGGLATASGVGGCGYIQHSIYLPFLQVLFRIFDKRNVLFIKAEDFFADPVSTAMAIYRFLDLPDYEPIRVPIKNAGPPGEMDDATRSLLADFFEPLNRELYTFVKSDFAWH
jgi:hypothetical protein